MGWVSDSARLGLGFFLMFGSRILRGLRGLREPANVPLNSLNVADQIQDVLCQAN